MKYLILLSILSLVGCAETRYSIANGLETYVEIFLKEGSNRGKNIVITNLTIEFATNPPQPNVLGMCTLYSGEASIKVFQPAWDNLDLAAKEILMLHELGHCVLTRTHLDAYTSLGYPVSIMNTYLLNSLVYSSNRREYLDEFYK